MKKIPLIGLGTWDLRGSECTKIIHLALEIGYRHIDTAHVYENHSAIKKGIQGFPREELFLTSKLSIDQVDLHDIPASVEKACDLALKELGVDYLDLYLLHWPDHKKPMDKMFHAMEKLLHKKKILRAGVSNFTVHHLEDILREGCKPSFNQVEFHPYLFQKELLTFCKDEQIQLIAYRPLGKGKILKEPLFKEIGEKHHKTPAQVALRWLVQQEIPTIPKASSEKHLKENLEVLAFQLTPKEMEMIDHLNRNQRFCAPEDTEFNY